MQFPESWLREFCDPPLSTEQLAELLTMSGMEVEELRPLAPAFTGVVVGQVLVGRKASERRSVERVQGRCRHRRTLAHRLRRAERAPGMKAPCALVGAELPPAQMAASRSRSSWASCAASRARACCARRAS